ncbi:MAG: beta-agarase [Rikenellaceae bacterium]|nr:beta-agarase [Rikenellaceae bacterium]
MKIKNLLLSVAVFLACFGYAKQPEKITLIDPANIDIFSRSNTELNIMRNAIELTTTSGVSGVYFVGNWDLTGYNRIRFKVKNFDPIQSLEMTVHLQEELKNVSMKRHVKAGTMTKLFVVRPNEEKTMEVMFPPVIKHPEVNDCFSRMKNPPYSFCGHYAYNVDLSKIKVVKIFANRHLADTRYMVSDVEILAGKRVEPEAWMQMSKEKFFPFIDKYGQFKHKDWEGKTHSDEDLKKAREIEEKDLAAHTGATDWTKYGGWKNGPKLKGTGHFRVEKVDGKWWMVDPEGYLFWSHGVVRVTPSSGITPLDKREYYFENLPAENDEFAKFYHTHDILLKPYYTARKLKSTYDYSSANAYRKYGPDYKNIYADLAHRRLKSWGLNTIANSSDRDICMMDRTVYTERIEIHSKPIKGTTGWWPFMDPFDPSFGKVLRERMLSHKEQLDDPWCLGFFVDNEIKWGNTRSLAAAVIKAPATQQAKIVMIDWLKEKYGEIAALNRVWGMEFESWEALLANRTKVSKKADWDLKVFNKRIIETYFSTIRRIFKEIAPQKLYLGCRFAGSNADVLSIAARYCDVISYNIYRSDLRWFSLPTGIDKPVMIGEFHFGALDRGLFHAGQVYTENQEERAQMYYNYVRSALEHPLFIGTHWHQFSDQAASGRFDGENFQVGFTDICDKPYYETIAKIREVGYKMYEIRSKAK